jgi:MFS family permease
MFIRRYFRLLKDPVWSKVLTLSLALSFVMLADALISFWAPNLLETSLNSSILMGVVIGFQSVIGFLADLVFPNLLKNVTVRRLVILAIMTSAMTILALVGASIKPLVLIFLVSMGLWGVYYEFEGFACFEFMANTVPLTIRTGAWGVMGIFRNLAYFLGPLLGAWILVFGNLPLAGVALSLLFIGLIIILVSGKSHDRKLTIDVRRVNLVQELIHWRTLIVHVWPVIVMSLLLGFIDATFWTTGAVLTENLSKGNPLGALFLPLYSFPSLFMGLVVAKWGIYKGKKKTAGKFLIGAGLVLMLLLVSHNLYWQLLMVLISGILLSITYPLIEGVYTDINARLGREKTHMIGLTSSVINLSYIIWPVIAGLITDRLGVGATFAITGGLVAFVSFILLFVTPKKLLLPQKEIKTWE